MLSTKVSGRLTTATEAAFARLIRQAGGKIHCISKGIGILVKIDQVYHLILTL
jgi:hypothetical protein